MVEKNIYSRGFGVDFGLLEVSLVEKFMNINKLERKLVLVVWLGGVAKQEKDRHVITTERSLLFTK